MRRTERSGLTHTPPGVKQTAGGELSSVLSEALEGQDGAVQPRELSSVLSEALEGQDGAVQPRELSLVVSEALEGQDGGHGLRAGPTGRVCVCMWLIHSAVQQKHSIVKQPNSNLKKDHTVLTPVVSWVKMDIATFLTLFFCAKFALAIPAPLLFT